MCRPAHPRLAIAPGVEMPLLGLGVRGAAPGRETREAVEWALEAGYRLIDTSSNHGNEADVGAAFRSAALPRDELFVTAQSAPHAVDPRGDLERSLERLGIETVDLYLLPCPTADPLWEELELARAEGLARAIGVSGCSRDELLGLTRAASVSPAVNQVRFSPFDFRHRLLLCCAELGVTLAASGPLARGSDLAHPVIADVALRHGRTPAQVVLRWAIERDVAVVPKSVHRERIIENARIFDFNLDADGFVALDALDRTDGSPLAR